MPCETGVSVSGLVIYSKSDEDESLTTTEIAMAETLALP